MQVERPMAVPSSNPAPVSLWEVLVAQAAFGVPIGLIVSKSSMAAPGEWVLILAWCLAFAGAPSAVRDFVLGAGARFHWSGRFAICAWAFFIGVLAVWIGIGAARGDFYLQCTLALAWVIPPTSILLALVNLAWTWRTRRLWRWVPIALVCVALAGYFAVLPWPPVLR